MDETLKTFLVDLANDRGKLAEFMRDREAYLEKFSLPLDARKAILEGDERGIARLSAAGMEGEPGSKPNFMPPSFKPPEKKEPAKPTPKKKPSKKKPSKRKAPKKKPAKRKPSKKKPARRKAVRRRAPKRRAKK